MVVGEVDAQAFSSCDEDWSSQSSLSFEDEHGLLMDLDDDFIFSKQALPSFTCPICAEPETQQGDGIKETLECGHEICRGCLQKSVQHNMKRCPVCMTTLSAFDIFRGTSNATQWIAAEQDMIWRQGGCRGVRCCNPDCIGVTVVDEEFQEPAMVPCEKSCGESFCGRCHNPWRPHHECEDLTRAQERAREVARVRSEAGCWYPLIRWLKAKSSSLELVENQVVLDDSTLAKLVETSEVLEGMDRNAETFTKPCPGCRVQTDRDGGCNIIHCTTCSKNWCFLCGRGEEHGCSHYVCVG